MATQAVPLTPRRQARTRFSVAPYLFLAPAFLTVCVLTVFPILYTIYVSFTNYSLNNSGTPGHPVSLVGLKNYTDLLAPNGIFLQLFVPVFSWTVGFALITSVANYVVGLILAVVLNNRHLPERAIYRTMLIVPWALPSTISILVWQGLFNEQFGPINLLLQSICVPGLHHVCLPTIPWFTNTDGTRAAILLVNLWLGFPFQMIVCLGGLQSIPGDIYEAAAVDGATAWQRLRSITMPLVFRVTLPALIFTFSYNLTNFGVVYLLNTGNPPRVDTSFAGTTDVLITLIYKLTLQFYLYDKAAALAIIVFVITAALSMIGFRVTGAFKEVQA